MQLILSRFHGFPGGSPGVVSENIKCLGFFGSLCSLCWILIWFSLVLHWFSMAFESIRWISQRIPGNSLPKHWFGAYREPKETLWILNCFRDDWHITSNSHPKSGWLAQEPGPVPRKGRRPARAKTNAPFNSISLQNLSMSGSRPIPGKGRRPARAEILDFLIEFQYKI